MSVFAPYGKVPGAWPTGITQSRGPSNVLVPGAYLEPYDPYFNMRGEAGFFHDTALGAVSSPVVGWWRRLKARRALRGLGAIPTDFELSHTANYTPVASGWVAAQQGYFTPSWLPPDGWAQGGYAVPVQPNDGGGSYEPSTAMRFGLSDTPAPSATVEDVMFAMNSHNDKVFALALVSTSAVAISALLSVFRTLKLIGSGGD